MRPIRGLRSQASPYRPALVATILLASIIIPSIGAFAFEEDEPNDVPYEANAIPPGQGDGLDGSCVESPDYGSIFYADHRAVEIGYDIRGVGGGPAATTLSLFTPSGVEFRRQEVNGSGSLNVSLYEGADYTVAVRCTGTVERWRLSLQTVSFNTAPVGPDELEHNDMASVASDMQAGNASRGYASVTTDPVDVWRARAGTSGDLLVSLNVFDRLEAQLWTVGPDGAPLAVSGNSIILRNVALANQFLAVVATAGSGLYNLTWFPAPAPIKTYEGSDEQESNDLGLTATRVIGAAHLLLNGTADLNDDPVDFFRIQFQYPASVKIGIVGMSDCGRPKCTHLALLETDESEALDPFGDPLDGISGYDFPAPAGASYLIRVDACAPNVNYAVVVTAPRFFLNEGAEVDINSANSTGAVRAFATGSGDHPELHAVNFVKGGNGTIYGQSLLLYVASEAPVRLNVTVLAGTRLKGEDPDLLRFVVTRDSSFEISPFSLKVVPLTAVIEGPYAESGGEGRYPDFGVLYFLDGMATGNLSRVTNETSSGKYDYKAEVLAVWAANGIGQGVMEHYGATSSEVADSSAVLNGAQVYTPINPAPPAPVPPPPPPNWAAAGLMVAIMVAALVFVGAYVTRSSKKLDLPESPPTTGAPVSPLSSLPQANFQGLVPVASTPGYYQGYPAPAGYGLAWPYVSSSPQPPGPYYGYAATAGWWQPAPQPLTPSPPTPPPPSVCHACGREGAPNAPYCVYCGEFYTR